MQFSLDAPLAVIDYPLPPVLEFAEQGMSITGSGKDDVTEDEDTREKTIVEASYGMNSLEAER